MLSRVQGLRKIATRVILAIFIHLE
jgi:hypothetical protein